MGNTARSSNAVNRGSFAASLHLLIAACLLTCGSASAVTYTTSPAAVTAGYTQTVPLNITRSLDPDDEGFSPDEMDSFKWYGPNNPYPTGPAVPLGHANMQSLTSLTIAIPSNLLLVAGPVTITYIADPRH